MPRITLNLQLSEHLFQSASIRPTGSCSIFLRNNYNPEVSLSYPRTFFPSIFFFVLWSLLNWLSRLTGYVMLGCIEISIQRFHQVLKSCIVSFVIGSHQLAKIHCGPFRNELRRLFFGAWYVIVIVFFSYLNSIVRKQLMFSISYSSNISFQNCSLFHFFNCYHIFVCNEYIIHINK